ncbi:unnamed protein product [Brassicogethes aeneus]|uniref:Uncharacterized protein n=1 Tax=Brassicogethes aeneus TaxID=1431903 RepID=A0A9P0AU35_BRAAE|nr:unnamed protein product [Brassicogethes aeneus]
MNECPECKEIDILFSCLPLQYNPEEPMQIKQWSTIDRKTKTIILLETIESAIEMLEKQMTPFRKHHFVKNLQQKYFDFKRKNIEIGDVILQIDFAENFQLIAQDEIQSAHWQHEQVTIFTAVAWLAEKVYSFSIISNYLVHDKYAVYVFLKKIISWIDLSGYKVKDLSVFSDGQNCGYWAEENPNWMPQSPPLLGSIFIENLNGARYLEMPREQVVPNFAELFLNLLEPNLPNERIWL